MKINATFLQKKRAKVQFFYKILTKIQIMRKTNDYFNIFHYKKAHKTAILKKIFTEIRKK